MLWRWSLDHPDCYTGTKAKSENEEEDFGFDWMDESKSKGNVNDSSKNCDLIGVDCRVWVRVRVP